MELDGVAGEVLQAQRGITPGCAFATTLLQLPAAAGGTALGGTSGASDCDHKRVAQELELASTCMAAKLTQAGCEIATMKSKVLSNSISVRAKLQARLQPHGDADKTKPRNRPRVREASDHAGATGAAGEVQRTCQADQENPRQIVGTVAATVAGLNETQLQQSRSQMASCLVKRMHGKSATMVL